MDKTELGDRMKMYERAEAGRSLMPRLPAMARLDGKCFSKYTKGLKRPFDDRFYLCMYKVTLQLVKETGALMGYTQSDEISLVWQSDGEIWFNGKIHKMTSVLAAMAAVEFNYTAAVVLPEKKDKRPLFDARVWNVPSETEAANAFLWRELDATKNSIGMAASRYYSHKQLMHKHSGDKQEMLHAAGVNWNDYPNHFKRGTFIRRVAREIPFSAEELDRLPAKHAARSNPNLLVLRSVVEELPMPPFATVTNREDVIFRQAEPETAKK